MVFDPYISFQALAARIAHEEHGASLPPPQPLQEGTTDARES